MRSGRRGAALPTPKCRVEPDEFSARVELRAFEGRLFSSTMPRVVLCEEPLVAARLIDGKALGASVRARVTGEVGAFRARTGIGPGLSVVIVGDDAASHVYVRNKRKACAEAGIGSNLHALPAGTSESALLELVQGLNDDRSVHGILVQLPLPPGVREARVLEAVDPLKDVDGFHPINAGLLALGRPRFVPCTPLGVREMLLHAGVETRGARVVVVGRSNVVGKPMALLLMQKGAGGDATVTVAHTATRDAHEIARGADILVVAAGRPEFVDASWIKPGAAVIDVGIHRRADGSLCGDVRFDAAVRTAGVLTPVPGGVGPMTIAMLLKNTLLAARLQAGETIE